MSYTIFVEGPFDRHINRSKLKLNCGGQLVVFDGTATRAEVEQACARLAPHCQCVVAFAGKDIGRLVIHWHRGQQQPIPPDFQRCSDPRCSYCGGTFFAQQEARPSNPPRSADDSQIADLH